MVDTETVKWIMLYAVMLGFLNVASSRMSQAGNIWPLLICLFF